MGFPHSLDRRLAQAAARIKRRDAEITKRVNRARRADGRYAAADGRAGNVITLHPEPAAIPAPAAIPSTTAAPSILSVNPIELRNHESAVVECLNGALGEGIAEMRAIIADPRTPDERKLRTFALLMKAKHELTQAHLKAARIAAAELDLMNASDAERTAFHRMQEAVRLAKDGFTVIDPSGRTITPHQRDALAIDPEDD